MSYGRNPHYVWSDGEYLHINGEAIPENVINAFLYKILLTNRREELKERLTEGKHEWLNLIRFKDVKDLDNWEVEEIPEDDSELLAVKKSMERNEDNILKELMGC